MRSATHCIDVSVAPLVPPTLHWTLATGHAQRTALGYSNIGMDDFREGGCPVTRAEAPSPAEDRLLNEFQDSDRARRSRDGGAFAGLKLSVTGVHAECAIAPHRSPA